MQHAAHLAAPLAPPPVRDRPTFGPADRPGVDPKGRGLLDWDWLTCPLTDRFLPLPFVGLKALDGKPVTLVGYMSPLDEIGRMNSFMLLEFPLGCYFCTAPEPNGIVFVELTRGSTIEMQLEPVKLTGVFRINATDPDDFLFRIEGARVLPVD